MKNGMLVLKTLRALDETFVPFVFKKILNTKASKDYIKDTKVFSKQITGNEPAYYFFESESPATLDSVSGTSPSE